MGLLTLLALVFVLPSTVELHRRKLQVLLIVVLAWFLVPRRYELLS